ncbi:response regulator [Gramella jeungdoensis]|uniref:Response regulator n=1 Tax=Gramella jeungdoensis TaxID=708091 RepID=A0ABT0Z1W2_9FLAO|nr:response regulator [Gramella jeungdoensis]MCM8569529.1 response regulator [Gramella jeungdoensis]
MKKIDCTWIVDDDPIFLYYMRRIMRSLDAFEDVKICENGREALKDLKKASKIDNRSIPNLIFLDLNMPVMDGWQFLDELQKMEKSKDIIIYIVTSSVDPSDKEKASAYDFVEDYIVKPLKADNLKNIISKHINHYA